ncbi:hypothetical protein EPUS_07438 [Endocarpon pusillum Z07020]|uniref:Major facilitator superfamily (MFS) profile domain-containing protein n=1 Tax=Endocarpon pusillum (strain Z07020 / HMAS-L-300199) TaxID=1263415 RepID=U1HM86_ENDPU|nr:uncharacterized protein EPUS_07438 [Endocarpon pusillum Z07020]ERF71410.1 hypothetical protein EPUS_07438 [Endocarpon pusillum Z07020]
MESRCRSSVVDIARPDDGVLRINDEAIRRMSVANPDIRNINQEARNATENEQNMTPRQDLKLYPKAVLFSIIFSTAVVMEGYDLSVMNSFYAFTPFKNFYGDQPDPEEGGMLVSAKWQTGISNGVQVGSIFGLYLNGIISEAIGYKKTKFGSLVLMIAFVFIPFFAQNLPTLLAGGILQGMPWASFKPRQLLTRRKYARSLYGQLLPPTSTCVGLWASLSPPASCAAFLIPVPILIGTIFAPESPWWLTRKGRYEDAKKSLLALTLRKSDTPFNPDEQVSMMKATTKLEKALSKSASYLQCFRGTDARRTEIASVAWVIQAFCGSAFMGYSTQLYERAGLTNENSFNMSLGQYAMGAVGTMGS